MFNKRSNAFLRDAMSTRPSGFTSGCSSDRSATTILFGQHSSVFRKKSGQFSQRLLSIRHSADKPLEMSSAGSIWNPHIATAPEKNHHG